MRAVATITMLLCSCAWPGLASGQAAGPIDTQRPLTIQSQGSFFIGGTVRAAEGLSGTGTGSDVTRAGDITTGKMYVQY